MNLKNISAKWKWIAGIVIVLIILLGLGKMRKNGGSVTPPRHVSFVKQANGAGTHVWFMSTGQSKNSDVYYIIVLKNGKARTYRTYDNDTTLGKVSKMSDHEAIAYAKKQDKKYFDASAKEVNLAIHGDHDGFNADIEDGLSMPRYSLLERDNKLAGLGIKTGRQNSDNQDYIVTFNKDGHLTSSEKGTTQLNPELRVEHAAFPENLDLQNNDQTLKKKLYAGLKQNVENASYKAPEPMKVRTKTKTDDSGNEIVNQKVTIQYTDNFDSSLVQDNFLALAKKDPSMMKQLYGWQKTFEDLHDDMGPNYNERYDRAQSDYNNGINKIMSKKFCKELTDGVFGNYQEEYTLNLENPADFDIYDSHFIGYFRGSKNGYLVTKAQTKKQTAVFAR
ncbi:hypothetical protein [uncultured Limosilactobacillus sp.]|uniref:hypothetical protein n=1 Tax=uncultured Limosilactobacillus sp. TaxID=2837629 RepID=UPI0025ECEC01|nr:hypothetical protein [uncultured Limosilactobacillus sp.]